jgi:nicotinamidase/pyrazinamidase
MKGTKALVVVDLQNDFCPGGALPVYRGDEIIEPTNRLITSFEKDGLPIFFTRDWHPTYHCSFQSQGGPWPPHCVRNSYGAQFHPSLHIPKGASIISKGTRKDVEAYSGFQGTNLVERLKDRGVNELYVVGLATDYCVKNTVLDGISNGFEVNIVSDCVRGVNMRPSDSETAITEMTRAGTKKIPSDLLIKSLIETDKNPRVASRTRSS